MRHDAKAHGRSSANAACPAETGDQRRTRRLEAFIPEVRSAILDLASFSPAVEDLAESFPALLFALATRFGTESGRSAALAAVTEGRSLKEVAERLGLPFWLRKLPPLAFQAPIIKPPAEPGLASRLVSLIPEQTNATAPWLERVLLAHHTGRRDLTLWVAQSYRGSTPSATSEPFLRLLAWAWHEGATGTRGEALLGARWTPDIGLRRAAGEAVLWKERIALDVCLGPGIADTWLAEREAHGYAFVALRTADQFIAEAQVMDNCLDRYADRLDGRAIRIFSIRRDGRSIADIEIACHEREHSLPAISQLRAARNRRAPMEVWQAAYAWLGDQALRPVEANLTIKTTRAERRRRQEAIWRPFIDALPETARAKCEAQLMPSAPSSRKTATAAPSQ